MTESLTMQERIKLTDVAMETIKLEAARIAADRDRDDDREEKTINHMKDLIKG